MKGVILAGGMGERLFPITRSASKQLLPVYDKPMIFYPLCALMRAGAREVLVIVRPGELERFRTLLDDGSQWGMDIRYATQDAANGIAEAPLIAAPFLDDEPFVLALGDNIFCGDGFDTSLAEAGDAPSKAAILVKQVADAGHYGVVEFDGKGRVVGIIEKPTSPPSDYAVTGMYFYDASAVEIARGLSPSGRGELEITDINNAYLEAGDLSVVVLPDDVSWLDMGTPDGLLEAAQLVSAEQARIGERIGVPEHIALRNGWIDEAQLEKVAAAYGDNDYGRYLQTLIQGQ